MTTEGYRDNCPPKEESMYDLEVKIGFTKQGKIPLLFRYRDIKKFLTAKVLSEAQNVFQQAFAVKENQMYEIGLHMINFNEVSDIEFVWCPQD